MKGKKPSRSEWTECSLDQKKGNATQKPAGGGAAMADPKRSSKTNFKHKSGNKIVGQ